MMCIFRSSNSSSDNSKVIIIYINILEGMPDITQANVNLRHC